MLMLFPPLPVLKTLEEELKTLDIEITTDGCIIKISDWLTKAFNIKAFVDALDLTTNVLELKFGGDGFHMAQTHKQMNIYLTLFNLGTLIHSPLYVFTLATIRGKESKQLLENNLPLMLQELDLLCKDGISIDVRYDNIPLCN